MNTEMTNTKKTAAKMTKTTKRFIPVTAKYVTETLTKLTPDTSARDIYYIKGRKTGSELSEKDYKKLSNSRVLKKVFKDAKADGSVNSEELEGYAFFVESRATDADIERILEIDALREKLDEERAPLEALIKADAVLYYNENGINMPSVSTDSGTVTLVVTSSVGEDKPRALKKLLNDKEGDYVVRNTEYRLTPIAKSIIQIIHLGNYDNHTTIEELINHLFLNYGCKKSVTPDELMNSFKKTVEANKVFLQKIFDIPDAAAYTAANKYAAIKNYDAVLNFMRTCGIDVENKEQCEQFIDEVMRTVTVRVAHRLTTKPARPDKEA